MADAVSQTLQTQKLFQEIPSNHANTSKFFFHFLYKAAIVTIFFILLPFYPSRAPEFVNQTIHARSWEFLELIFVGIAVSYGLFSKKNDETDKDNTIKLDNAQSYVSKLLQVSSVFYDETENTTVIDENKVQTWNSQYYMGEPVVVVAKESPVVKDENGASSGISQKPLLLPVRSLKQSLSGANEVDLVDDFGGKKGTVNKSSSKRFTGNLRKSRNEEFEGLESTKLEEKMEENVVFRSPIPWRTRSGRMEMKENEDGPSSYTSFSPYMEDSEVINLESRSFKSSRPNSSPKKLSPLPSISSPRKLSPSTSFSSESQAKSSEDVVRKKNFSSPPPVPPPPPPPPPFVRKSVLMKSNSSVMNDTISSEKVLTRSVRNVPAEEWSESEMEERPRRTNSGTESWGVRTFKPIEPVMGAEKKPTEYETKFIEKKGYINTTTYEKIGNPAMQTHVKFPKEEKNKFSEKVLIETTDEESEAESEYNYFEGSSGNGEGAVNNNVIVNDVGPDVDKKADEFIAKFREQIRLQRIESIRRSTTQRAGKTLS